LAGLARRLHDRRIPERSRALRHPAQPTLSGRRVLLRPGFTADAAALHRIRAEPSVGLWWGPPDAEADIAAELRGESDEVLFVVEVEGEIAGCIQYSEETEPDYRHAGIDLYLGERHQGQGLGSEAIAVLAAYLIDERGHHRLTIDPAVANAQAIHAYERVGFRPVGVLRQYERSPDGVWRDGLLLDLVADELVREP
jgi:aminoglycoside 6'-N-acetyltransferase